MIGVIDYGAGNFTSVYNALKTITEDLATVTSPAGLDAASHIVLPGVGAFGSAMKRLSALGLVDSLEYHVRGQKKPFLGICVGMQILATTGHEFGCHNGLGWIDGEVRQLAHSRLPHMGWNEVILDDPPTIFGEIENGSTYYFVHSFALELAQGTSGIRTALTDYDQKFVSAVQRDNIFGVQFHPEKSQDTGLKLLKNFIELTC